MSYKNLVAFRAFGNNIEAMMNEVLLPSAMSRLRSQLTMPGLITVNGNDESKKVGETIVIPKPVYFASADDYKDNDELGTKASDVDVDGVEVKLNRHIYKEVAFSDREYSGMAPGVIPDSLGSAVDVLARTINADIFGLAAEVYGVSGRIDSENARTKTDLTAARKVMHNSNVFGDKTLVLTADTEHDLLNIFTAGNDQQAEKEGTIGRRFGFDIFTDNQAPMHFSGSASAETGLTVGSSVSAGANILVISGATEGADVVKGDIITIGSQTFAVAEPATAGVDGDIVVHVSNRATADIASGTAATVAGDHRIDLAFHKSAFVIAFRQLVTSEGPESPEGTTIGSLTDPDTGITLQMLRWYVPKTRKFHYKVETFYGVKAVAPERAIRVGGH